MKIAYTHPGINQKVGGVSRYFFEICIRLQRRYDLNYVTRFSGNLYFKHILNNKKPFLENINFKGKSLLEFFLQKQYAKRLFKRETFDLIHHTGEYPQLFCFVKKTPVVITIHDLIPEIYYPNETVRINNRKQCIHRASAVICVSNNTRNDLLRFFPEIPPEKVFVVYHGTEEKAPAAYRKNDKGNYILYIGSRYTYKNFNFFVESVAGLLKEKQLVLYCTGESFSENEKVIINRLELNSLVVNCGYVDDIELANLYHYARCFVYPSLYEGFGIPILEAFRHQCPVCLSDASCFPEIAADAAKYFNPNNSESIKKAITEMLYDIERERFIQKGSMRLNDFSWEKTASDTAEVYNWVIKISKKNKTKNSISIG
jgi:glycosyltransferase involved in cell wall biosynthesis